MNSDHSSPHGMGHRGTASDLCGPISVLAPSTGDGTFLINPKRQGRVASPHAIFTVGYTGVSSDDGLLTKRVFHGEDGALVKRAAANPIRGTFTPIEYTGTADEGAHRRDPQGDLRLVAVWDSRAHVSAFSSACILALNAYQRRWREV